MTGARSARLPWVVAGALLLGTLIGSAGAILSGPSAPRSEPPAALVELPRDLGSSSAERSAWPAAEGTPSAAGPPLVLDGALFEATPGGLVPRIAPDGRRPRDVHRRRADPLPGPRVAVLLLEIGLDAKASAQALTLPAPVTFVVSPYADPAQSWFRAARWAGHETLLELPARPERFPIEDAGPLALAPDGTPASQLDRILVRGIGYLGVATHAGAFRARPEAFAAVAESLARRGLALAEIGSTALEPVANRFGLPYRGVATAIDENPSAEAIDVALAALEARASSEGVALGYGRPLPVTLDRLARWSRSLPSRGISLVGIGELLRAETASKGPSP